MKSVGLFMNLQEDDEDIRNRQEAIKEGLSGFTVGRDVDLIFRYGGGGHNRYPDIARDLVGLNPDVLFASCGPSFWALQKALGDAKKRIPIIFAGMIDAYSAQRIAAPPDDENDNNFAGYISYTSGLCSRWVEYL